MKKLIVTFFPVLLLISLIIPAFSAAPRPVAAKNGMVVSASELASQIGCDILKSGGNAVDAAVATAFALGVVEQYSSGIGGGNFIMIYLADKDTVIAIDGRETAPAAAFRDMYIDSTTGKPNPVLSTEGILAGGVPGAVASLSLALEKFGTKSLKEVLKPSIELAEKGFMVTQGYNEHLEYNKGLLAKFPESKAIYFKGDTTVLQFGDVLVQKDLGWSYRQISEKGPSAFYSGEIARKIVDFEAKNKGLITAKDLADYRPKFRTPVKGTYRGYEVISMPPPSSGGVHLIQMLNILENYKLDQFGFNSSQYIHTLAEAMKQAFADRAEYLGDPDFVKIPVDTMLDKGYALAVYNRTKSYQPNYVAPGKLTAIPDTSGHTTHLSVVDSKGNMCAITATVNTGYGSGMTIAGTGIILNDEMDDFSAQPGTPNYFGLVGAEANSIQAGKRPLSSMTPTFVLKDGKPFMVTGSPGGPRIITATLQSILNVIDFRMDVQEAVSVSRIHHQWKPDCIYVEYGTPLDVIENLAAKGHRVEVRGAGSTVEAIVIDPVTGLRYGGADPRSDGKAVGY